VRPRRWREVSKWAVALLLCCSCGGAGDWGYGDELPGPNGSASLRFQSGECGTVQPDVYAMPTGDEPTSGSHVGEMAEDEDDGVVVDCIVAPADNDAIAVDTLLECESQRFRAVGSVEPVRSGVYSGSGTVEYTSPEFGELSSAPGACTLTVSSDQDISTDWPQRVWADFSCPSMNGADTSSPMSQCAATGTFAFQYCHIR